MGTDAAWVLHVDLDQFVAAVEVLRRPELAGKQVVVGGHGDPTERGVVSTASYEARERGVHSGMPLRVAARKLPDGVFLPVDAAAYEAASERVMATLRSLGVVVEVLGWDEAFLGARTDDPELLARRAQEAVLRATDLHCSVGIGDNKVRAKIATDLGKPAGVFRLTSENWFDVMGERPTIALWGVGSKVSRRLSALGVTTVRELAGSPVDALVAEFGPRMGVWYHELGHGIGPAAVDDAPWVPRGHSRETTFQQNLTTPEQVREAVSALAREVVEDVAQDGRPVVRVALKVRYAPFVTTGMSRRLPAPTTDAAAVLEAAAALAERVEDREVRLLGVRAEMLMPRDGDPADRTPVRGRI
ncbi:DNA polymerase IV [Cellulomonas fimi]|uniref:DNA-directed DNA polymerase n=1 Tax=Cellulomonas fimi (strain ATCC 484 / DSM 20113 / JCM 1341 / CCUG 24087 / LMG 16345 / NBRC 15513 / NCIMB 8980 / NCTC 7547 / NRS-133) TaxID=590998 RepID=F4H3I4_CELFA|nr:DNA polymerase IV [Cellulomonas fimi]AEE46529.1 DNA-directed DNA polymerase [Cellulomonas fimi ATCC 484]NNH08743.1 DNA polymerase IV [Cellulomonas fimi]VEH33362.1 DNA polymerase IV [Cellulomonas fimi]